MAKGAFRRAPGARSGWRRSRRRSWTPWRRRGPRGGRGGGRRRRGRGQGGWPLAEANPANWGWRGGGDIPISKALDQWPLVIRVV